MRILFVCLGNICRSPTAEAVFRAKAEAAGLSVEADGAGTGGWHVGEPPDRRAQAAARRRGYDLSHLRARQVRAADFEDFDLILAMDRGNLAALERMRPAGAAARLRLFLGYAPQSGLSEAPDPYYDGSFERMLDLVEAACEGLIARIGAGGPL